MRIFLHCVYSRRFFLIFYNKISINHRPLPSPPLSFKLMVIFHILKNIPSFIRIQYNESINSEEFKLFKYSITSEFHYYTTDVAKFDMMFYLLLQ